MSILSKLATDVVKTAASKQGGKLEKNLASDVTTLATQKIAGLGSLAAKEIGHSSSNAAKWLKGLGAGAGLGIGAMGAGSLLGTAVGEGMNAYDSGQMANDAELEANTQDELNFMKRRMHNRMNARKDALNDIGVSALTGFNNLLDSVQPASDLVYGTVQQANRGIKADDTRKALNDIGVSSLTGFNNLLDSVQPASDLVYGTVQQANRGIKADNTRKALNDISEYAHTGFNNLVDRLQPVNNTIAAAVQQVRNNAKITAEEDAMMDARNRYVNLLERIDTIKNMPRVNVGDLSLNPDFHGALADARTYRDTVNDILNSQHLVHSLPATGAENYLLGANLSGPDYNSYAESFGDELATQRYNRAAAEQTRNAKIRAALQAALTNGGELPVGPTTAGEAINNTVNAIKKAPRQALNYIDRKGTQFSNYVGDKAQQGVKAVEQGISAGKKAITDTVHAGTKAVKKTYNAGKEKLKNAYNAVLDTPDATTEVINRKLYGEQADTARIYNQYLRAVQKLQLKLKNDEDVDPQLATDVLQRFIRAKQDARNAGLLQ